MNPRNRKGEKVSEEGEQEEARERGKNSEGTCRSPHTPSWPERLSKAPHTRRRDEHVIALPRQHHPPSHYIKELLSRGRGAGEGSFVDSLAAVEDTQLRAGQGSPSARMEKDRGLPSQLGLHAKYLPSTGSNADALVGCGEKENEEE